MSMHKRILIADDEVIFLKATSNMLHEHGYKCDCATDAESALEMLRSNDYDLLISDLKMPGNSDMEFVGNVSAYTYGLPIIVVTAYPSIDNAIQALKFHVCDYMLKPVDFGTLLERVNEAFKNFSIYQDVTLELKKSISKWSQDLDNIQRLASKTSKDAYVKSFNSYLDVIFKNMFDTLMSMRDMTKNVFMENDEQPLFNLKEFEKLEKLRDALAETVSVLRRTKDSFKSKDLGALRGRLERLLAETS